MSSRLLQHVALKRILVAVIVLDDQKLGWQRSSGVHAVAASKVIAHSLLLFLRNYDMPISYSLVDSPRHNWKG